MNISQGPHYIDDLLTFSVTTHKFDTGVLTDADAVPAYRVYEDETGTAILTGNMAKLDDANTTGFYSEQLTLSAANGFEVGKTYSIYVTAAVNSVSGGLSGSFRLSGVHPANVTQLGGVTQSLTDLKDFADDGYDPSTNKVQGVVLVDTTTDVTNGSTLQELVDGVWDEPTSAHTTAGTTGKALTDAGSAGDPWTTALPGAYGAGTAGKILGDNLNATVSSRATQTSVDDVPTNAELATALAAADDAVLAAIAALNNLSQANIRTAVGLASPNLDTQLADLPTNGELTAAFAAADDAVLAAIAALNNLSAAQVNAQVVDALATDTYAEPGAVPAATATLADKIGFLMALARNKVTQTATLQAVRNDADSGDIATASVSDDGTTFTRGEFA